MSIKLDCPVCGSLLKLSVAYTGADWDCKAGEGSGFVHQLSLDCTNVDCNRFYTLGHLKEEHDFSEVIDKDKCVL